MKRQFILLFFIVAAAILTVSSVFIAVLAQNEYSLNLLAVSDKGGGTTAGLYLALANGTGNVFVESSTPTKIDTKISMKLAKEISCRSIQAISGKCDNYDFFFRLVANASLVGGPSAGAAAAGLAAAAVDNDVINPSIAVTGTINSGGIVGGVGGLTDKIDAAAAAGLSQVLIPRGERYARSGNATVDLVEYGRSIGMEVTEVETVEDVLWYLTGKNYSVTDSNVEIDPHYSEVMSGLSSDLCIRSSALSVNVSNSTLMEAGNSLRLYTQNASSLGNLSEGLASLLNEARNETFSGFTEKEENSHYSAASLCFSSNVKYSYLLLLNLNITPAEALKQLNNTAAAATDLQHVIPTVTTIAGLQVKGTVTERIAETNDLIDASRADFESGDYASGMYGLAYATERLGSAISWSRFLSSNYTTSGGAVPSQSVLRDGCITGLQEAEERIQYLDVYLPGVITSQTELGPAYSYLQEADFASCIYRASLTTAKVNALLTSLGGDNLTILVRETLTASKKSIIRQTAKGDFPIIGYSYYEYATSLQQDNPSSALLYSEYALELSNLDIYAKPGPAAANDDIVDDTAKDILIGVAYGFGSAAVILCIVLIARSRFRSKKRIILKARRW